MINVKSIYVVGSNLQIAHSGIKIRTEIFYKLVCRKFPTTHILKGHLSFKHMRNTSVFINTVKKTCKKHMLFK